MATKTNYQTFQSDWTKTLAWAHSQNISPASYLPVYNIDSKRILSGGSPMSEAERINAIHASAGISAPTSVPQDHPNPTNVIQNTKSNLQNIFTGLEPIGLVKNIWDTLTHAIDNPSSQIAKPLVDLAVMANDTILRNHAGAQNAMHDFAKTTLGDHSIMGLVPGFWDLAQMTRGGQGWSEMAANPISSLLDIAPAGDVAVRVLSHTAKGAEIAGKIGLAPEELRGLQPAQVAWRLLKEKDTKLKNIIKDPTTGVTKYRNLTFGERKAMTANRKMVGGEQGQLTKHITVTSEEMTHEVEKVAGPPIKALGELPDKASVEKVTNTVYTDFRRESEILNDPQFTPKEVDALQKIFEWGHWNLNLKMAAGQIIPIKTPYGTELYLTRPGSGGPELLRQQGKATKAQDILHEKSAHHDQLIQHSQDLDADLHTVTQQISAMTKNFFANIQASIPQINRTDVADVLKQALPEQQKWNRQVYKGENLEKLFGIDSKTIDVVDRGKGIESEPFTGDMKTWSDAERKAWYTAWDDLTRTHNLTPIGTHGRGGALQRRGRDPKIPRSQIKANAIAHLKAFGHLRTKDTHGSVSITAARALTDIIGPGQLMDQAIKAYEDHDFAKLRDAANLMHKKIHNKSFQSPTRSNALIQLEGAVETLRNFSRSRAKIQTELDALWHGRNQAGHVIQSGKGKFTNSIEHLTKVAEQEATKFATMALQNPPDVWRNAFLEELTKETVKNENGARMMDDFAKSLGKSHDWTDTETYKLRTDPRAIMEMIDATGKATYENKMAEYLPRDEVKAIIQSAYENIGAMRARGERPQYIPTVTPFDIRGGVAARPFNVFVGADRIPSVASSFAKIFDHTSSIYNLQAAMLKDTREIYRQHGTIEVLDKYVAPITHDRADLWNLFQQYRKDEILNSTVRGAGGEAPAMSVQAAFESFLTDNNLMGFDPNGLFGMTLPRFAGKKLYIDKDIGSALSQSVNKFQMPADAAIDKVTGIFRTSILGYSPRFTMHIVAGGSMLVGLRMSPDAMRHTFNAYHIAKTGKLPEDVAKKYGFTDQNFNIRELIQNSSTQEGNESIVWHNATGYSMGQFVIQDWIARMFGATDLKHPDYMTRYLKVLPGINMRFTRFATRMQSSFVFLDGASHAAKHGHFYEDVVNDSGQVERIKHEGMTPEHIRDEGMQKVIHVMGDLRAMSPLERNVAIRVMPFWGWTKHILKYVFTYPMDHPYRASVLAHLATQNSQDVQSGLPTRIQLLAFLGSPDRQGNVTALDARAINPLRDTANYASLSGWLSSLNPIITAPFQSVDPNITFGQNVMYPSISYSSFYGTNAAGAQGNVLNAVEGIVPEVTAMDQAFNLSGQYAYLHQTGQSSKFWSKLGTSLNFPWVPQHLNIKEMAASDEMKRYQQAKTDATTAWTTGDFAKLDGYTSVPDPRNPMYNTSPKYLEELYAATLKQTGLPPSEVTKRLPNPSLSQ